MAIGRTETKAGARWDVHVTTLDRRSVHLGRFASYAEALARMSQYWREQCAIDEPRRGKWRAAARQHVSELRRRKRRAEKPDFVPGRYRNLQLALRRLNAEAKRAASPFSKRRKFF